MPMVRGLRTLNAIQSASITGACLDTLLQDGGRYSDFSTILTMPGQTCSFVSSNTGMCAVSNSTSAMCALFSSPMAICAITCSAYGLSNLFTNQCSLSFLTSGSNARATSAYNCILSNECAKYLIGTSQSAVNTLITCGSSTLRALTPSKCFALGLYTNNAAYGYCCAITNNWSWSSSDLGAYASTCCSNCANLGQMYYSNGYCVFMQNWTGCPTGGITCGQYGLGYWTYLCNMCVFVSCPGVTWRAVPTGFCSMLCGYCNSVCGYNLFTCACGSMTPQVGGVFIVPITSCMNSGVCSFAACVVNLNCICLLCNQGTNSPCLKGHVPSGGATWWCGMGYVLNSCATSVTNNFGSAVTYFTNNGMIGWCCSVSGRISGVGISPGWHKSIAPIGNNNWNVFIDWPCAACGWCGAALCGPSFRTWNPSTGVCSSVGTYACGSTSIFCCGMCNYQICGAIHVSGTCYHIGVTSGKGTIYSCDGSTFNVFNGAGSCPTYSGGAMISNTCGVVVIIPQTGNCFSMSCTCGCTWTNVSVPISGYWMTPTEVECYKFSVGNVGSLFYAFDYCGCCGVISNDGVNWRTICPSAPLFLRLSSVNCGFTPCNFCGAYMSKFESPNTGQFGWMGVACCGCYFGMCSGCGYYCGTLSINNYVS